MHILLLVLEIVVAICAGLFFFAKGDQFEVDLFVIILIAIFLHFLLNFFLICRSSSCLLSCSKWLFSFYLKNETLVSSLSLEPVGRLWFPRSSESQPYKNYPFSLFTIQKLVPVCITCNFWWLFFIICNTTFFTMSLSLCITIHSPHLSMKIVRINIIW